MATKPTGLKVWASNDNALVTEPANAQKKSGFGIEQPSVNIFNGILRNVYSWIDYLDTDQVVGGSGDSSFTHIHKTAMSRIQLPFTFSETGTKLSQIEVFKQVEESVGGTGTTINKGTGAVAVSEETAGASSVTFTTSPVDTTSLGRTDQGPDSLYFRGESAAQMRGGELGFDLDFHGPTRYRFRSGGGGDDEDRPKVAGTEPLTFNEFEYNILTQEMRNLDFRVANIDAGDPGDLDAIFTSLPSFYLILAENAAGLARGECIIWDLSNFSSFEIFRSADRSLPVYSGIASSPRVNYYQFATSYTAVTGESTGGGEISLSTAPTLSGSPSFSLASISHAGSKFKITLGGTVTATSFFLFKIAKDGEDIFSKLSSAATYLATDKSFSWDAATNPISTAGSYEFIFENAGSGIASFVWTLLTTGLAIENYGDASVNFLNISSGVVNNQVILVRKK